jgi:hypothetical protein
MTTAFDKLRPWGFGGLRFPVGDSSVRGRIRDHVHEYPHSPGGAPEKLGRALYEMRAGAMFIAPSALAPDMRATYPDLFPGTLGALRTLYESQQTKPLTIPTIGTIDAYIFEWDERKVAKDNSSVLVEITWREDQDRATLADVLQVDFGGIAPMLDHLNEIKADVYRTGPPPSIWDQINSMALQVLAIKDSADLYGNLVAAKIDGFASLLRSADESVAELNHPDNQDLTEALHALWSATVDLQKNFSSGERGQVREYTVPLQMPIGDVSVAIFQDASHAVDLMQLNPIEDPLAIPAGTVLRYIAIAA